MLESQPSEAQGIPMWLFFRSLRIPGKSASELPFTSEQLIVRKSSGHSEPGLQRDRGQVGELYPETVRPGPAESVQLGLDACDSSPLRGLIK